MLQAQWILVLFDTGIKLERRYMQSLSKKIKVFLYLLPLLSASGLACEDENYRQFDFWIGKWEVSRPDGTVAGTNQITKSLNDCILHEHYQSVNGYEGTSVNIFNKNTQQWHQTWVDNTGLLLQLDGGLVNQDMVMWGEGMDQSGRIVKHRISWSPNENGTVIQRWQVSHDQGMSWQMLFEGTYKKQP